jgi:hypothetical protein
MEKTNISEIEFQLNKLILRYSGLFVYHQWPSEHKRWVELIFALLTRISKKPEDRIRDIIEELDALNLLSVEELAEISEKDSGINLNDPHAKRIVAYLSESGFTEEESKNSILVMHEAAKSLKENHNGKIQEYLRVYGQRMIDELSQNFSFSKMNEEDEKYAFTYWLQNILNMPINLKTESVEKFCKKLQITYKELLKAADNLNINLALLDDMIDQYIRDL